MPLLNDMARCMGQRPHPSGLPWDQLCARRDYCARYVERHQGGPRTMIYAYLCSKDDNYIHAENQSDSQDVDIDDNDQKTYVFGVDEREAWDD